MGVGSALTLSISHPSRTKNSLKASPLISIAILFALTALSRGQGLDLSGADQRVYGLRLCLQMVWCATFLNLRTLSNLHFFCLTKHTITHL